MDTARSPTRANVRPRSRKSITHIPASELISSKENRSTKVPSNPALASPVKAAAKKSRSKSLGPGGLEALRDNSGNRQKSAVALQYKSILKPTVPLSPPKAIPPHNNARRVSPGKSKEISSPGRPRANKPTDSPKTEDVFAAVKTTGPTGEPANRTNQSSSVSPSRDFLRVAVRTEEQQQAAVAERERQDILARKDARRKSLANRRVSFAPEATLHTWDVVEMPEDSTTSSASTNSTRRASSLTGSAPSPNPPQSQSPRRVYEASEPPSTPPRQAEEVQVEGSPAHQRDLHQKKRRRSSGIPPMNFNNPDDFSSSPCSPGSIHSDDAYQVSQDDEIDAPSSDSDDKDLVEDETVTGVDGEDVTKHSNNSSNTGSSSKLEEALRQAAQQAGTQGIDYDENGDITMEMADDEVTAAFKPWDQQANGVALSLGESSAQHDQENINPFSPAFRARTLRAVAEDRNETMDFTMAIGGILPQAPKESGEAQACPGTYGQGMSADLRRRDSGETLDLDDETVDLTVAVGGIAPKGNAASVEEVNTTSGASDDDEELSMDFTAVVGGVLGRKTILEQLDSTPESSYFRQLPNSQSKDVGKSYPAEENMRQGMTSAIKQGLQPGTEALRNTEDVTSRMDITTAIGSILSQKPDIEDRAQANELMELEPDGNRRRAIVDPSPNTPISDSLTLETSGQSGLTGILGPMPDNWRLPESSMASMTPEVPSPQIPSPHPSPSQKPATPPKQLTPKEVRPTTPGKTPSPKNVAMRTGSPKKLFESEIKQATISPGQNTAKNSSQRDPQANKVMRFDGHVKPPSRRTSGIGIDRSGLGSPKVTEILERRSSLKESSEYFVSNGHSREGVRFADPRHLEHELEQERLRDEQRERGRDILQSEANEQQFLADENATTNLKDKIQSLTPQKKRLNGRKSLHVGAARGLLGKRPIELDDEEEDDGITQMNPRAMEGSPVKRVKLPAPPPKSTTSGRITRSGRAGLVETSANARPSTPLTSASLSKAGLVETPKDQPRFRDASLTANSLKAGLDQTEAPATQEPAIAEPPETEDPIHLQDFLNLTSIRFMELTTTRRRHTVLQSHSFEHSTMDADPQTDGTAQGNIGDGLENCVVAGACTLPMLDLYQHSCRELKKYIAEGRNIVREIEAETFEDNPSLFREYICAPIEVKSVMDNQFKNVKTHARLLSKAMWYEWRMKLLEGLKEGLASNGLEMVKDSESLTHQEHLIRISLPDLTLEHDRLESDVRALQAQADVLASCDQDELKEARSNLVTISDDVITKWGMIENLLNRLSDTETRLEYSIERKLECAAEIQEAERIRQESRGWEFPEIQSLQDSVNGLERDHGWAVTTAAEGTLTLTYKRTLQLYFTPGAFKPAESHLSVAGSLNAPISLTYTADHHQYHPQPLSTEKRFFLQSMRAQLQFLQQSQMTTRDLLTFISSSWDKACRVSEEGRLLSLRYITEPVILSDETLLIQSTILLRDLKTKVNVAFEISISGGGNVGDMEVAVKPNARVVYGEESDEKKMGDFLLQKLDKRKKKDHESGGWAVVVGELEQRLIARGKRL